VPYLKQKILDLRPLRLSPGLSDFIIFHMGRCDFLLQIKFKCWKFRIFSSHKPSYQGSVGCGQNLTAIDTWPFMRTRLIKTVFGFTLSFSCIKPSCLHKFLLYSRSLSVKKTTHNIRNIFRELELCLVALGEYQLLIIFKMAHNITCCVTTILLTKTVAL